MRPTPSPATPSVAPLLCGGPAQAAQKNLTNLTPHPLYSGFYYSHPTLLERERPGEDV